MTVETSAVRLIRNRQQLSQDLAQLQKRYQQTVPVGRMEELGWLFSELQEKYDLVAPMATQFIEDMPPRTKRSLGLETLST